MNKIHLSARYPQNFILRKPVYGALILFLFMSVFMILYQPFDASESRWFNFRVSMFVYSLGASGMALFMILLLKRTRLLGRKKRWTLPRELLSIYIVLQSMGIAVFLLGFIMEDNSTMSRWNLHTFFDSCKNTILIGIIPFIYFTGINYRYLLEGAGPAFIDMEEESDDKAGPMIHVSSSLKKESLGFRVNELLFVSSDGNYVDFFLRGDNTPRKVPIRNSISNIEQQFREIPHYFRCHRAFIVNMKAVVSKKGNALGYQVTLQDCPQKIPVSRQKVKAFDKRYSEVAS
jgi:hypothetical protein